MMTRLGIGIHVFFMGTLAAGSMQAQQAARAIEIVADSSYRFTLPGQAKQVLNVKAGEPLLLRITAHRGSAMARDGAVHSLVIRSLRGEGWDIRLKEGTQEQAVQAPSKAGTYLIECTVVCGPGHENMNLKMEVSQ